MTAETARTPAVPAVRDDGKRMSEIRYLKCSACGHREYCSTADYKILVKPQGVNRVGYWRFKTKAELPVVRCVCKAGTMTFCKQTRYMSPDEAMPEIGIRVHLMDIAEGEDPAVESPMNEKLPTEIPVVVPQEPIAGNPLVEPGQDPAGAGSADDIFDDSKPEGA